MIPDQVPPGEDWIVQELRALRAELREQRAERSLEAATISAGFVTIKSGGTLRVLHPNGSELFAVRRNASGAYIVTMRRDNGSVAFEIQSLNPASAGQYWALFDRAGRVILSDDAISGDGLARPWLPIPFMRIDTGPPANSGMPITTSGAFVPVLEAHTHRQHPWLEARMYVGASADGVTIGEGRLMMGATQIGTTVTTAAGGVKVETQKQRITNQFGELAQLSYEIRRTAGAGNVYGMVHAWWRQT